MSVLAAIVLAAATARVEAVSLAAVDSHLGVRVTLSGQPGMVSVHREGGAARISVAGAALGARFTGGQRFAWTPDGVDTSRLSGPTRIDRLEVVATPAEVSVLLHVPADVSVEVHRDRRGLLLMLREGSQPEPDPSLIAVKKPSPVAATAPARPARRTPPPVGAAAPTPTPEPAAPPAAPAAAPPAAPEPMRAPLAEPAPPPPVSLAAAPDAVSAPVQSPSSDTAALARSLFASGQASTGTGLSSQQSVGELYSSLFPQGVPETQPETVEVPAVEPVGPSEGIAAGPFRVQLGVDIRYVDADTFVEASGEPVRDQYLEIAPGVSAVAPVGEGRLSLGYLPVLRAFATYDDVNSSSHRFTGDIDLPLTPSVRLHATDTFVRGLLDTRVVDPGGEYFFGLGRFNRNDVDADLTILTGPRTSIELGGGYGAVTFKEPSTFFDYSQRRAFAGLGYELSPRLRVVGGYAFDQVPTPTDRPEAEATAHSGEVRLLGDVLPLLSGSVSVGYRSQDSPNAGPDGRHYRGFVMDGTLTRQFSPDSSFSLYLNRSTPVSAFEDNGFYVSTGVQGAGRFPLPLQLQLQGGIGYQWNDYRTPAEEIGVPREDRILALYVGLRRPIRRQLFVSATYRREERTSNVDRFDTNTDGFFLQLEWDIFGSPPR